jgi:hypothetical protein
MRVFVQFTPAAGISILGLEEVDGPLEFMGPVFLRCDFTLAGVDLNYGASRDHRAQGLVEFANDTRKIWRTGRCILYREQRGLVWRLVRKWRIPAQTCCLGLLCAFRLVSILQGCKWRKIVSTIRKTHSWAFRVVSVCETDDRGHHGLRSRVILWGSAIIWSMRILS